VVRELGPQCFDLTLQVVALLGRGDAGVDDAMSIALFVDEGGGVGLVRFIPKTLVDIVESVVGWTSDGVDFSLLVPVA
jgi:hypothetical protein